MTDEYKVIHVSNRETLEQELNEAAQAKWKWVDSLTTQNVGNVLVVMKRTKDEEPATIDADAFGRAIS